MLADGAGTIRPWRAALVLADFGKPAFGWAAIFLWTVRWPPAARLTPQERTGSTSGLRHASMDRRAFGLSAREHERQFRDFRLAQLRDGAWATLTLLVVLAVADGPLNDREAAVLRRCAAMARTRHGLAEDAAHDAELVGAYACRRHGAQEIRRAARALVCGEARHDFPALFAAMAVADGLPGGRERRTIRRIKAAIADALRWREARLLREY